MLQNYVTSAIRTIVPLIAAWLLLHIPYLANLVTTEQAQTALAFVLAAVWYLVVRAIEAKWPVILGFRVGILLGVPTPPVYAPKGQVLVAAKNVGGQYVVSGPTATTTGNGNPTGAVTVTAQPAPGQVTS